MPNFKDSNVLSGEHGGWDGDLGCWSSALATRSAGQQLRDQPDERIDAGLKIGRFNPV